MDIKTGAYGDSPKDGVRVVKLSWGEFRQEVINLTAGRDYAWRGQRKDWPLKSSFDRNSGCGNQESRDKLLKEHSENFKKEMNQSHPNVLPNNENDIWALGQHYGLNTPLLDWTLSPYIAAYFAFEEPIDQDRDDGYRYIYALNKSLRRLMTGRRNRFVDFVETVKYPSPRFLAQNGIFTRAWNGYDIETNAKRWSRIRPSEVILVKFKMPSKDRAKCLRELHLMNIDYKTLLLDLRDVVDRCNNTLRDCHAP